MRSIYVIDVLDAPGYSFPERFQRFLDFEKLKLDWVLVDGVRESHLLPGLLEQNPAGIVISGSVRGVYDDLPWLTALEDLIRRAHERSVPLLGICFGHQLLARAMGGKAEKGAGWEFGVHPVYLYPEAAHPCLEGFTSGTLTVQTHQDYVVELPPGAKALGFSRQSAYQIFSLGSCLGIQFHPEYTHQDL
ncbi:MAG: type 1 glutamine amidotransferase, partial [Candidatus Sericytochromatia bacterium]